MGRDAKVGDRLILAVDFDGTLCEDKFPEIGAPRLEVIKMVKEAQAHGCLLVLWTCRIGQLIDDAVDWCNAHGMTFDAVNDNVRENTDKYGSNPRKVYADFYLDDRSYTDHNTLNKTIKGWECNES